MIKKSLDLALQHHKHFAKFCVVGLFTAFVSYAIFYSSLEFLKINYLISSSIAFICGIFVGYPINKKWTFDFEVSKKNMLTYYFMVYIFSLILSLIFLKIIVDYVGVDPRIAFVLSIILTAFTNFIGTRIFVFS